MRMKNFYPIRPFYDNMDLNEFKKSGRNNIIKTAVEKMKAQYPHFNLENDKQVRIFASDSTVRVILGIALFLGPSSMVKWVQKWNYETVFRTDNVICFPFNPREDFILDDKAKEMIAIVLKERSLSLDENFSIMDREEFYSVDIFSDRAGEIYGYKVDKKNGNWELKSHRPPQNWPKGSMPQVDLGIDDGEIFTEIKG
jgi:hypothetical protein